MHDDATALPFDDSRRLTGPNLYFAGTGVALEALWPRPVTPALIEAWRQRVQRACRALGWPEPDWVAKVHASGASLAFTAPFDQLYAATEVNEWAWMAALVHAQFATPEAQGLAPGHASLIEEGAALPTLKSLAAAEAHPALVALQAAARARDLPFRSDDEHATVGEGAGSRSWRIDAVPAIDDVPWPQLHAIPTALVTGSNGKTTTVRLLSALLRGQGLHTVHSCTDGLYLDGELLEGGDYSGPGGARALLRNTHAQAAVLETARGGLLRRGLAVEAANVAVVSNVQPDHFGEYGIHSLEDLARVKFTVARAIDREGLLVLNADDPLLHASAERFAHTIGWFAEDDSAPLLVAHRAQGGATCAVADGQLWLSWKGERHGLGTVSAMPITLAGSARHNIANAAAASLAAVALGVAPACIARVLAEFGRVASDNPGRLQRWTLGNVDITVDYAHNPDGLRHLLAIAQRTRGAGRLGLMLGQAGNRPDADIRALARVACEFDPGCVVLKELDGYQRGRADGEVAAILHDEFRRRGVPEDRLQIELDEVLAARILLSWARPGDVIVLPTHATAARERVTHLLTRMQQAGWQPGMPLPD